MLSDSSEEVNCDSTGAYNSMVTALKMHPTIKSSISFYIVIFSGKKKLFPWFAVNYSSGQKLHQKRNISDHPLLSIHKIKSVSVAESLQHIQLQFHPRLISILRTPPAPNPGLALELQHCSGTCWWFSIICTIHSLWCFLGVLAKWLRIL